MNKIRWAKIMLIAAGCLTAGVVLAAELGGQIDINLPNPLGTESLGGLIQRIIDIATKFVAVPVATLMIIIGAFQILSASGNPEGLKKGKQTIIYALAGLAVLLLSDLFVSLVMELLGKK